MKKIFLIAIVFSTVLFSQTKNNGSLSGLLFADSKISFENKKDIDSLTNVIFNDGKKSPLLAAVFSFALPGAGEFYTKSYIKSAAFLVVEAAAITIGLIYNKKGDDQTNFFQNFAEDNWSVQRYAQWTLNHAATINPKVNAADYNVLTNGKINWGELNRLESDLGSYYSHRLAYHGEQQYYEMIGKYQQFNPGWEDFGDENTPYTYGDPLTQKFLYYSKERGKANDFYNIASKAVVVIVANHFISALDAAWTANRFNKDLKLSAELKKIDVGYYSYFYPQLNLSYCF